MPPIVCIVGKESNMGKTTLIEHLVVEFKRRGYRVATVKHAVHGFDLDQPGKDSWRHARAGSDAVVLSSPQKLALIKDVDHDPTLAEMSWLIGPAIDIILAEGFKQSRGLKVEIHHKDLGELISDPRELIAVVTDEPLELDVPQFGPDDVVKLADMIESRLLESKEEVALSVDGA